MSIKDTFSAEEWQTLKIGLPMVGAYIATAGGMGIVSVLKEMGAIVGAMQEAYKTGSGGELVQALIAEAKESDDAQGELNKIQGDGTEAVRAAILEQVKAAVATAGKAGAAGDDYKAFLMVVADKVAVAAKEGGFLGFGGEQVSAEEKQALSDLSGVLGVPAPAR